MLERPSFPRTQHLAGSVSLLHEGWQLPALQGNAALTFCAAEVFEQNQDAPGPQAQLTPRARIQNQVQAAIQYVLDHPNVAANALQFPAGVPPLTASQIARLREYQRDNQPDRIAALQLEIVNFRMNVRQFQLDLIQLSNRLDDNAVVALLPQAAWQARETQLRAEIRTEVDAAIRIVREAIQRDPNIATSAITFPNDPQNPCAHLSAAEITELRNLIQNGQNTDTYRDELVNVRLQPELPAARHTLLRELLAREAETGVFGPLSRATYNQVAAMITRDVYTTLFNFDDRGLAFPPGCPVIPPLGDLNNRHVSDQLFRSLIRRLHNGDQNTGINWGLPTLGNGAELTLDHMRQFGNAITWLRDAQRVIAPLDIEIQRQLLERQIAELGQPGWARALYPNVEQWHARARTLVGLALQIRQASRLTHTLHDRFPNFALGDVDQPPPLPASLDVTHDNQVMIQNVQAWLQRQQERLAQQLARLMDARDGNGLFMLGEIDNSPGTLHLPGRDIEYNRITADFEIVEGPRDAQNRRTYRVTPIVRYHYHWLPLPRYMNHWGIQDGVVYEHRGTVQTLTEGELVLAARPGSGSSSVELMTVDDLRSWRNGNWYYLWLNGQQTRENVGDVLNAAVDLSMIVTGTIEIGAGFTAAANALRAGLTWRTAAAALGRLALAGLAGGRNLLLGSAGIFESPYWGRDPLNFPLVGDVGITARHITLARHIAFLFDAARALRAGRGVGQLTAPANWREATSFQEVMQSVAWMRRLEAIVELRIPPLGRLGSRVPIFNRLAPNWQGDLVTPFMMGMLTLEGWDSIRELTQTLWQRLTGQHPHGLDLGQMNLNEISQQLVRLEQSPTFFRAFTNGLLENAGLTPNQIATFRGIIADARPDPGPDQPPPPRRRDREQQLIEQFNRPGATERERLVAAALILIEASRSTTDHSVPGGNLGNENSGVTAQILKDYLLDRFRNSGDPGIRLLAAQMLLSTRNMAPPVFGNFVASLARNNNTPREVRMQAISILAGYLHTASVAERHLNGRIAAGRATQMHMDAYLTENFGVTREDLHACLTSIATDRGADLDIRAFSAAALHAVNHGDSDQVRRRLQVIIDRWNANNNQPPGRFALATLNFFAQELALPVNRGRPQDRENQERVFMAASALTLLSDTSFQPLWREQREGAAAAAAALVGGFGAPFEPGVVGALQPPVALPIVALTPEVLNNALLSCVSIAQPDVAVQALQLLIPRINPNEQQIGNGIFALCPQQISTLRARTMSLLGRFVQPEAQLSEVQQQQRAAARLQVFEMIPALFATANDVQRRNVLLELGHTLRPDGTRLITDNPEIRRAAAIAIGLLMQNRPAARAYIGNDALAAVPDALFAPLQPGVPPIPLASLTNQYLIHDDESAVARLEAAVRNDPSAAVRLASLEALVLLRPPILSNGRTLERFCTELLERETDPVVLALLRRIALAEYTIDPTSPDWMDDFQRARYDLLFSLNCRGDQSLAGVPAFLFNPANGLTTTDQMLHNGVRRNGTPIFDADDPRYAPYLAPYHRLNSGALEQMARGDGPNALNALRALVYIITSRGRPFERRVEQGPAVAASVAILSRLARDVDVNANPNKAADILWGLELCLVLDSGLDRRDRLALLNAYMQLVDRMPANAQRQHRAGVVASIVLQREAVSYIWSPRGANMPALTPEELIERRRSEELQLACMRYLGTHRTRAALPVLESLTRTPTLPAPVLTAARDLLQLLRNDPQIVTPGTLGGPLPGTLNFDDAYEALRRQYLDGSNGLFLQPGLYEIQPGTRNLVLRDPTCGPGATPAQRALLISFANGTWLANYRMLEFAPNAHFIWWQSHQWNPHLAQEGRPPGATPQAGMDALIRLAEMDGSSEQGERRTLHLRFQREARMYLAWIVAVNGEGLLHGMRDHFVEQAAAALERISRLRIDGLADIDSVIEAALVGQPLMSRSRAVRLHLIEALWNRRASAGGSIANERVALILAGALRSEFQTMPRPGEEGYLNSIRIQLRCLELLRQLPPYRICAPVVQALSLHHPDGEIRERAHQTLLYLLDNTWRVWDRVSHAQIDTTTSPQLRAQALRAALASNGTPDDLAQAIFHAYLGRPIVGNDPRYRPFMEALSDTRPQVRLAAALVVLRTTIRTDTGVADTLSTLLQPNALLVSGLNQFENTAFNQNDRNAAMAVVADLAMRGVHVGLRESARRILREILPDGQYVVHPSPGTSIAIVKNGANVCVVECRNGHPVAAMFSNGQIRRQGDGLDPPLLDAIVRDPLASRALGLISIHSISTALAGPLSDQTSIVYDPITNQNDWRRFWIVNDVATGPERIAQLYALIDARSTGVENLTKRLAVYQLIQLGVDGNAQSMQQITWMFRHLDPALAPAAIRALHMRLFSELRAIPQGQAPSELQRQRINRTLELVLAVCQSSPLNQASRDELSSMFHDISRSAFADSASVREIARIFANSVTGPITASNDIRLQWLHSSQHALQFAAARDCLLPTSTAVTSEQRIYAIRLLSRLAIEGNDEVCSQAKIMLSRLTGADLNAALDALAVFATELQGVTPPDRAKILRCWTLSEELCVNAHLDLDPSCERYLRARLEHVRAQGVAADDFEVHSLRQQLLDCQFLQSYNPSAPFTTFAAQRYGVMRLAAIERYGPDSLEVARIELALANVAYSRSVFSADPKVQLESRQRALEHAQHAYQVLILRLGPNAPEVCEASYRLGIIELSMNNLNDAITHLNEALAIYRRNPARIGIGNGAWIASQLAIAYLRNGNLASAERISGELLKMTANAVGVQQRYDVIAALTELAEGFVRFPRKPQHASAEPLWRRALDIARSFGESDPKTLELMLRLAQNLAAQGQNMEAVTLMNNAMTLCEQQRSMPPAVRARLYRAYAWALVEMGKLREAAEAFERRDELEAEAAAAAAR